MEKLLGSFPLPAAVHQHIQPLAILIDRPPRLGPFAIGREKHLVRVPGVTGPRAPATRVMRVGLATLPAPRAHGFVYYEDTTYSSSLISR